MIQYAAATPYFHVDANSPGGGYMVWPQPIYAVRPSPSSLVLEHELIHLSFSFGLIRCLRSFHQRSRPFLPSSIQ
jgi:hypothetical protein